MNNVKEDLLHAEELIDVTHANTFDYLYPFCNENIKDLFSYFDFNNKSCLTVTASSDQILDMNLGGTRNITAFDINGLTKYYFYLKKAALDANISFEEFINYFCFEDFYEKECNYNTFNIDTFNRIKKYLPDDSYQFWATLYNKYSPKEIRVPFRLFTSDENSKDILAQSITYFNEESFEKLKETIKNINIYFMNCDLKVLPVYLENTFDFMYLSNIIQYCDYMFKNYEHLSSIDNQRTKLLRFKNIIEVLANYLNEDGYCIVGYLYEPEYTDQDVAIYNKKLREEVFKESNYSYLHIKSLQNIYRRQKFGITDLKQELSLIYKK